MEAMKSPLMHQKLNWPATILLVLRRHMSETLLSTTLNPKQGLTHS